MASEFSHLGRSSAASDRSQALFGRSSCSSSPCRSRFSRSDCRRTSSQTSTNVACIPYSDHILLCKMLRADINFNTLGPCDMLSHMPGQAHLQYAYDAQESDAEHYRHQMAAKLKVTLLAIPSRTGRQKKTEIFQRMKQLVSGQGVGTCRARTGPAPRRTRVIQQLVTH